MTAIPKHRVLSLISDKKYHSVFLTTYAFDFAFFETTVIRQLKANHLVNINVLADYGQLHEALGVTTGFARSISRGYTITGITSPGVFHPKLFLFIGDKEGSLIIGSGNITPSGFGRNMEVWGAFHINGPEDPKAGMFLQAWEYIKSLIHRIPGSIKQRILFAEQNAPWMGNIESKDNVLIDSNSELYFLYNDTAGSTIANRIEELITGEAHEIVVLSPFYDKNLSLLERFYDLYKPVRIKVIMPSEGMLLPVTVPDKILEVVIFSKWEEIFRHDQRKLHAKIIYFNMVNRDEYFLFGSTNATLSAFGYHNRPNDEVSLLLKNPGTKILSDLGLPETLKQCQLSDFSKVGPRNEGNPLVSPQSFPVRLIAVEQTENEFRLFVESKHEPQNLTAKVFDSYGEVIDTFPVKCKKEKCSFSTGKTRIFNALYIQLYHDESPVSNKQIIQELREIYSGNPSKELRRIEEIFSLINSGGDPIELLDYIVFDEEEEESTRKDSDKGKIPVTAKKEPSESGEKNYKILSYEELTEEEEKDILLVKFKHLMKPEVKILDFLLSYIYQSPQHELETVDSDEEESENIDKSTGRSDEDNKKSAPEPFVELQVFKRISSKLKKHILGYSKHLRDLAIQAGKHDTNIVLSIREYSKFIIVTHFLLRYSDLHQKVKTRIDKETSNHKVFFTTGIAYHPYIPFSGNMGEFNFKALAIDILGDFLWLLLKAKKSLHKQSSWIEMYKKDALVNALLCVALLPYNDDREKYKKLKDLLFLNIIEYIGDSEISLIKDDEFKRKFQSLVLKAGRKDESAMLKIMAYYSKYQIRYQSFKNEMNKEPKLRKNIKKIEQIAANDIIFSSKYGFCSIYKIRDKYASKNGAILFRPGLHDEYDDDPFLSEPLPNTKFITL